MNSVEGPRLPNMDRTRLKGMTVGYFQESHTIAALFMM